MTTERSEAPAVRDRTYRGDCGVAVVVVAPCPEDVDLPMRCACGAEMCPEDER